MKSAVLPLSMISEDYGKTCPAHDTDMTAGLYLHIPFCRSKCAYCDFYSVPSLSMISDWLKGVLNESRLYGNRFSAFDSLYIGGGTPSLLPLDVLTELMEALFRFFPFRQNAEITLEANPDDITREKLMRYKSLGVNRISLGVQAFDDRGLQILKRRHDVRQTESAIERIRSAGFENLNLDLIYGYPGQSLSNWERTLDRAIRFSPEHLSCYQMTIETGTAFEGMAMRGRIRTANEEALII